MTDVTIIIPIIPSNLWEKKTTLYIIIFHFHLLIFVGNIFSSVTFLFKTGSLNNEADEVGVS